ncbi:MAG TPA: DUF397 domain-containing protein [Candidatus Saccharimonadales bacterium]|nr:DUF397 domain-containing protein [Candidatus Saccharimonadales bacterium]
MSSTNMMSEGSGLGESDYRWRTPRRSGPNCDNCFETRLNPDTGHVEVRDSKVSRLIGDEAPTLRFTLGEWAGIIEAEKKNRGEIPTAAIATGSLVLAHELEGGRTLVEAANKQGGVDWVISDQPDSILEFTGDEVEAWVADVVDDQLNFHERVLVNA